MNQTLRCAGKVLPVQNSISHNVLPSVSGFKSDAYTLERNVIWSSDQLLILIPNKKINFQIKGQLRISKHNKKTAHRS